jgi:phasin family protein
MFAAQEHFEKLGKEGMEAVLAAAGVQIGALQKLASLNLEATKAGFEAWSSNAQALAWAKDTEELAKVQSTLLQPDTDRALEYWRGVYGVAAQAYSEIARIAERQLAETRFGAAQGGLADPKAAKKAA